MQIDPAEYIIIQEPFEKYFKENSQWSFRLTPEFIKFA